MGPDPCFPADAGTTVDSDEMIASDDDQERRGDSCFLANEQSWRTAWLARSLLSWTKLSSRVRAPPTASRAIAMREDEQRAVGARFRWTVQGSRLSRPCRSDTHLPRC